MIDCKREFYETYKNDPTFLNVDVFLCIHPSAMCEIYMPFDKNLLVYIASELDSGRSGDAFNQWRENLKKVCLT